MCMDLFNVFLRRRYTGRMRLSSASIPVDPARCPLCGQANQCANEVARATGVAQLPCWCMQVDFGADLLARVPPEAQRRACICAACAGAVPPSGASRPG